MCLFLQDLEIEEELSRVRLVFFLEAGDIMQDFNNQIFTIMHRNSTVHTLHPVQYRQSISQATSQSVYMSIVQ